VTVTWAMRARIASPAASDKAPVTRARLPFSIVTASRISTATLVPLVVLRTRIPQSHTEDTPPKESKISARAVTLLPAGR
jgi:hypothetical protein